MTTCIKANMCHGGNRTPVTQYLKCCMFCQLFLIFTLQVYTAKVTTSQIKVAPEPFVVKICRGLCENFEQCHSNVHINPKTMCGMPKGFKLPLPSSPKYPEMYQSLIPARISVLGKVKEMCQQLWSKPRRKKRKVKGYIKLRAGKETIKVKYHMRELTWYTARKVCQYEGGDLVKVNTRQKNTAITRKFILNPVHFIQGRKGIVWIGLRDLKRDKKFKWGDGSPLVYNNWGKKEPNGVDEDCVVSIGVWNDDRCTKKYDFVCERR